MADTYQSAVSRYVRKVLDETGWTQQTLGERVGVAQSTIGRALDPDYEHRTKTTLLFKIQEVSGIPLPSEIAPRTDAPPASAGQRGRNASSRDLAIDIDEFGPLFRTLVKKVAGPRTAAKVTEKDLENQLDECRKWLRSEEPGISLTSRLTQYLLVSLAAVVARYRPDQAGDYVEWKALAEPAARYLVSVGQEPAGRRHKSG